jgi:hypothetical protein
MPSIFGNLDAVDELVLRALENRGVRPLALELLFGQTLDSSEPVRVQLDTEIQRQRKAITDLTRDATVWSKPSL